MAAFQDPELCQGCSRAWSPCSGPAAALCVLWKYAARIPVSIFQSGLRSLLPEGLTHLSGPGCPVCVTHDAEVGAMLELARRDGVIIATFGDLLRVPGPDGKSLKHAQAEGARVRVVYSPLDAVNLAGENPGATVIFPGVGFETTAPGVAGAVLAARERGLGNFCILSCHKLVPPALRILLEKSPGEQERGIDAFLLPGHVAVVLGLAPFRFVAEEFGRPAVIGGFEPAEILSALCVMISQIAEGKALAVNALPSRRGRWGKPRRARRHGQGLPAVSGPLARAWPHSRQRPRTAAGIRKV